MHAEKVQSDVVNTG